MLGYWLLNKNPYSVDLKVSKPSSFFKHFVNKILILWILTSGPDPGRLGYGMLNVHPYSVDLRVSKPSSFPTFDIKNPYSVDLDIRAGSWNECWDMGC